MSGSPLLGPDALPADVTIGGRAFPIRHSFRDGIRFETMMFDTSIPPEAKVEQALLIWFDLDTDFGGADLCEIIAAFLDFYRCGKPEVDDTEGDDGQLYSFEHDWDSIFAGFLNCYAINLLRGDVELHWWEFRSMLAALPAESQFMRILGYRTADVTSDMPKEQKAYIARMKHLHALPSDATTGRSRIRSRADYDAALAAVLAAKREAAANV
jgi:hypothetical protein